MLKGAPDAAYLAQAAAAGMPVPLPPQVPLWAELVPVVELFSAMRTQWVVAADGKPALNYAALPAVEQRLRISPRRARQVFPDLRVMEAEGRKWWTEQLGG